MKILITGSRGFIGGSLGRLASAVGHEVLGVSRSSQPEPDWPGRHIQADAAIHDLAPILREFQPDALLHAAGSASVAASLTEPAADFRAAATTFVNILDGVRRSGAQSLVVFPSSAAVYGNPAILPVGEEAPCAPISPYGFHKMTCELLAREYAQCFGVSSLVCRLFSVFGWRQRRLLVAELYEQFAGAAPRVEVQGTGAETRDFLHVDDLTRAILSTVPIVPRHSATVLNVASGVEMDVLALAGQIGAIVAPGKEVRCLGNSRPGDPLRWCADIRRLRSLLPEWRPMALVQGLDTTIEKWREESRSRS